MNCQKKMAAVALWAVGALAPGLVCSIASAQADPGSPPGEDKAPEVASAAPASEPPSEPSPAAAPAEPPLAPASTREDAQSGSVFRALGEKAAALPSSPPRKDRSLFEMSQGSKSSTSLGGSQPPKDEPERQPATLENLGNFQDHWQLFAHFRGSWVSDPNLDPFADNDFLPAVGAGGGRALYSQGQLSLAALAFVEASGTEAQVRGETSNLDTVRFAIGPELRYHFIPRSYVFARAFPELMRAETSLEDPTTAATLEDQQFAFALDLGAGIAFNAAGQPDGEGHQPRLWIVAEGGYGLSFLRDLELEPAKGDPAPARVEPLRWDAPSLNAPLMRLSVAMTL